ncbi:hypothetical protein GFL72_28655 [Rhizobium leguminosarum bv. viciae]|uniref:hypothetical protein n=1 Tax=Rhizobium leguminosarum TaxID=384 RepID=UPI001441A26E|nr:hypothetical protein [Rhizobium leguminosarum]NKK38553.1 hypothetical protein [Rhizobium leguminosarum bv. viciae]
MLTSLYFVIEPYLAAIIQYLIDKFWVINLISTGLGLLLLVGGSIVLNRYLTRAGVALIIGIVFSSCICGVAIYIMHDSPEFPRDKLVATFWAQCTYLSLYLLLYTIHHFVSKEDVTSTHGLLGYFFRWRDRMRASWRGEAKAFAGAALSEGDEAPSGRHDTY